jgi:cysteine desulfurase
MVPVRKVYLDNAATTPVHPDVVEIMVRYMAEDFGNASSIHSFGREARKAVDEARERVAALIGAPPRAIVFTSGGTEADNLAIRGVAYAGRDRGNHIITSAVEHHAVLHTCEYLEKEGFEVTVLPVDDHGMIAAEDVRRALRPTTTLVSIMHANNEVGTIQPIAAIGRICSEAGVVFHCDGVQAVGQIPVDVDELLVDLYSFSAHKMYGPKGTGALYVRAGTKLVPQALGGGHEGKRRAGTEGVPGIAGLGKAAELARAELPERAAHVSRLRDQLIDGVLSRIEHVRLNGHPTLRLPNNANLSVEFVEGESILLNLDMKGIAASSGSACTSGALLPSHVLMAMGLSHELAHGSLRMTLGRQNTVEDVDYVLRVLPEIVTRLRAMSPLHAGAKT